MSVEAQGDLRGMVKQPIQISQENALVGVFHLALLCKRNNQIASGACCLSL